MMLHDYFNFENDLGYILIQDPTIIQDSRVSVLDILKVTPNECIKKIQKRCQQPLQTTTTIGWMVAGMTMISKLTSPFSSCSKKAALREDIYYITPHASDRFQRIIYIYKMGRVG